MVLMRHLIIFIAAVLIAGCLQVAPSISGGRCAIDLVAAFDSKDVVQAAAKQQRVLGEFIQRMNQTRVHRSFATRLREVAGCPRRLLVIRHLDICAGFLNGHFGFEDSSPLTIPDTEEENGLDSALVVVFEDDHGWGYVTNAPDAIGKDAMLVSCKTIKGHVAGYAEHPKQRAAFEELFSECLARCKSKDHSVTIAPAKDSWDGSHIVVVTAVDRTGSASIAAINPSSLDGDSAEVAMKSGMDLLQRIWRDMKGDEE